MSYNPYHQAPTQTWPEDDSEYDYASHGSTMHVSQQSLVNEQNPTGSNEYPSGTMYGVGESLNSSSRPAYESGQYATQSPPTEYRDTSNDETHQSTGYIPNDRFHDNTAYRYQHQSDGSTSMDWSHNESATGVSSGQGGVPTAVEYSPPSRHVPLRLPDGMDRAPQPPISPETTRGYTEYSVPPQTTQYTEYSVPPRTTRGHTEYNASPDTTQGYTEYSVSPRAQQGYAEDVIPCPKGCGTVLTGIHALGNLTRHLKSEACTESTREKVKFPCLVTGCGKEYARSDGLKVHMRRRHGAPPPTARDPEYGQ